MGCWDELCLLCGVSGGGPNNLLSSYDVAQAAPKITSEILSASSTNATKTKHDESTLLAIVTDGLSSTFPDTNGPYGRRDWLPEGVESDDAVTADPRHYNTWRSIAVGYFQRVDNDGLPPVRLRDEEPTRLVPDGRHVSVRQVVDCYVGDYNIVVCTETLPDGKLGEVQKDRFSMCSVVHGYNPNVAMCERCYYYLKYWRDIEEDAPDGHGRELGFAGELYETVNSRKAERGACLFWTLEVLSY